MCCKCCQNCLETLYWHCFEKHFCYDENIALYEEDEYRKEAYSEQQPPKDEKNNNTYDNLAFYDNVAVIANRAIFSIDPIEPKPQAIITQQPKRKIASVLDPEPYKPPPQPPKPFVIPTIVEELSSTLNVSIGASMGGSLETISEDHTSSNLYPKKTHLSASTNALPVKLRKKSLHERRVSKSLTLNIEKTELPIIRQSSFPKFYLDTPEENQMEFSILRSPIQALETPILPNSQFRFDLKSVVQIEDEKFRENASTSVPKENRLNQIKDKLKPLKLLRSASSNSIKNIAS